MIQEISGMADAQKLASTGRIVEGRIALNDSDRLSGLVVDPFGQVDYRLSFFFDMVQRPCVKLSLSGSARLICQRSMEGFDFPIRSETQLGFIASEEEESALMPDFDPILITPATISFTGIVEDELILAIPQVPVNPALTKTDPGPGIWQAKPPEKSSPFANLSSLLKEKPANRD